MPKKVPPKKVQKRAKYSSNKSMRTFKSAQKSVFANKSAQKRTLKSTFGSSAPICFCNHAFVIKKIEKDFFKTTFHTAAQLLFFQPQ